MARHGQRGATVAAGAGRRGSASRSVPQLQWKAVAGETQAGAVLERGCDVASVSATGASCEGRLEEAYLSALTKFDSLVSFFASGMSVQQAAAMILQEMLNDKELVSCQGFCADRVGPFVTTQVGKAYNGWKSSGNAAKVIKSSGAAPQSNQLRWSSTDSYPEWVAKQVKKCEAKELAERSEALRALENTFLHEPLHAVSVKYDGTCFGKLDDGSFAGRNHIMEGCTEYQRTTVESVRSCDVAAIRAALSERLGVEMGQVCIYGELMCNPGYYAYADRGLDSQWLCFGAVACVAGGLDGRDEEAISAELARLSSALTAHGFAHSVSPEGKVRLLLCGALRQLLVSTAGCTVVEERFAGTSHAEMASAAAKSLIAGEEEGFVLVFSRGSDGQASVRKWKNSGEDQGASQRHAQDLRRCLQLCSGWEREGALDERVADFLATLLRVAEAKTQPTKRGRGRK